MSGREWKRREGLSLALVGVICVLAAAMLRTWAEPYLVGMGLATLAAVALVRRRARLGWWVLLSLAAFLTLASWQARRDVQAGPRSDSVSREELQHFKVVTDSVMPELRQMAFRLARVTLPTFGGHGAVATVLDAQDQEDLSGVVVRDSLDAGGKVLVTASEPVAWAGMLRLPLDLMTATEGIVRGEFYTVAYARAAGRGQHAVVARTLLATQPADRLTDSWGERQARRVGWSRVDGLTVRRDDAVPVTVGSDTALWLRPVPVPAAVQRVHEEEQHRGIVLFLLLLTGLAGLAMAWRVIDAMPGRLASLAVAGLVVANAPLSSLSNVVPLLDPAHYFQSSGGPFTASIGALLLTGALLCLAVFALVRDPGRRPPVWVTLPIAIGSVALGPFLLRHLGKGITVSPRGAPMMLWVAWEVALFLVTVAILLLAWWGAASISHRWRVRHGGAAGTMLAVVAAAMGPAILEAPGRFPEWYAALWIAAAASVALAGRVRAIALHIALVAACGTASLVWVSVTRKRVELAERDVAGLIATDAETRLLVLRLLDQARERPPESQADLLRLYATSDLAAAGNPIEIAVWQIDSLHAGPRAELVVAELAKRTEGERGLAAEADSTGAVILREYGSTQGVQLVLAAPLEPGRVISAVVAPRTRLIQDDPFSALLGLETAQTVEPPYAVSVGVRRQGTTTSSEWARRVDEIHRDFALDRVLPDLRAHVSVELRSLDVLLVRGALLVAVDLAVFGLLWLALVLSDRALARWLRGRLQRYRRSYRARLTLALLVAFSVPALAFAVWTWNRLQVADRVSRALLVQEALRSASHRDAPVLAEEAARLDVPFLRYDGGRLRETSDPLYLQMAPLGHLLHPAVASTILTSSEGAADAQVRIGAAETVVGYRSLGAGPVLAAPARRNELTLERQQRDVLSLLGIAAVIGALVALWLSGLAAQLLARPVSALRRAATDVTAGARELPSLGTKPVSEFREVFGTFRQMAVDLSDSRLALETARHRTEAILHDAASGVVALDRTGRVTISNPQADRVLGVVLAEGDTLARAGIAPLHERTQRFLEAGTASDAFDVEVRGREIRARLTRLALGDSGAVLTLDDVTDLTRAQRVFAWGEMARQVAHEIKNPLTPIRLGVQHLRRAHADRRPDFGEILDRNVDRVLAEIDRLDEIARAFSRMGLVPGESVATDVVDLEPVLSDVLDLERLGESGIDWAVECPGGLRVQAREGELREVLLNLLENARLAHARQVRVHATHEGDTVRIEVSDDGDGIDPQLLARVFEPHFSTRTSGSGLGLAICKRLVESWGGRISIARRAPTGTSVVLTLAQPPVTDQFS